MGHVASSAGFVAMLVCLNMRCVARLLAGIDAETVLGRDQPDLARSCGHGSGLLEREVRRTDTC